MSAQFVSRPHCAVFGGLRRVVLGGLRRALPVFAASLIVGRVVVAFPGPSVTYRFDAEGTETATEKFVKPGDAYDAKRGYGFEPGSTPDAVRFSIRIPEDHFIDLDLRVTVVLESEQATETTVKAEARRLMLERVPTKAGERVTRSFNVDVHQPKIDRTETSVKLNDREKAGFNWDDKLTLDVLAERPTLKQIVVTSSEHPPIAVYLAGDSTVCDQPNAPFSAWGAMLPRFFDDGVVVANHAESGRALRSFRNERRLDKILSRLNSGDYVLIQFGHNDQKDKSAGAGAMTTYKADLERYVDAIKEKGATPVIVTSMYRRRFDANGKLQDTLGEYPAAARLVVRERNIPLIDLHDLSGKLIVALGPEPSKKAFVHFPAGAFPGRNEALSDDSHSSDYGAYELAKCVIEAIRTSELPLAKHLRDDVKPFDPTKPDPFESFKLPSGVGGAFAKPEGS
ncbi:MAG: rhamnogalacturonan acetylesterase [Pirellulales bacterium]